MFEFTGFFQTNSIIYPHSLRQHVMVGVTCEGHCSGCTYHGGVSLRKIGLYQHQIYTFISSCQLIYTKSFPLINANTMKDKERIYQDCWLLKKTQLSLTLGFTDYSIPIHKVSYHANSPHT